MKPEIPNTIGYELDRALTMLKAYHVLVEETSTPFEDKKQERKEHPQVVVRQLNKEDAIQLTVARFK